MIWRFISVWAILGFLIWSGVAPAFATNDSVFIYPSRHGVEAGELRKTLAAYELQSPITSGSLEIYFQIPESSKHLIESLEILVTDSLDVRDLDDYKGRIQYESIPLNSWSRAQIPAKMLGDNTVVYITANLAKPQFYSPRDILRFKTKSINVAGKELPTETRGEETFRRFFRIYKPLFVPGDGGSRNYRIPAFIKTESGVIVAVADRRKFNQIDIPHDIDIIQRRSFDGGKTWSEPDILIEGQGYGKGYGDVALVQAKSGKLVMVFIGGPGLWGSTAQEPQPTYMMTSDDDGATWSEARDITHFLYGKDCSDPVRSQFLSSFCASGQGEVTCNGRIMFVAAMRSTSEYKLDNYLIYSDDEGETWEVSQLACEGGDEAKVIQLQDRSILMSVRNQQKGDRIFKLSYDNGETWQDAPKYSGLHDPACNGAPLLVRRSGKEVLLHSLPFGPNKRWDGAVYAYDDETGNWSDAVVINPGMSAYSDMLLIDDQTIGYFVEEDDQMSLVFITFTLNDLAVMMNE